MSQFPIAPNLQQMYAALVPFIMTVTGLDAAHVVQGLPNRAAMPTPGFVSVQGLFRHRLRTNITTWDEVTNPPTTATLEEGVELTLQIDCYGPDSTDIAPGSEDWASILSATLRSEYGVSQLSPLGLTPLYADDARMIPLVAGEEQYEERWAVDAHFQYNPVTTIPQQYADALQLTLKNVQEAYAP